MNSLKHCLKLSLWFCAILLGFFIIVYGLFLIVNLHDKKPSELVLSMDKANGDRIAVSNESNGYIYMLGFSANRKDNPAVLGLKKIHWLDTWESNTEENIKDVPEWNEEHFKSLRKKKISVLSNACKTPDDNCLKLLEEGKDTIREWLISEQWLLERYNSLLAYNLYQEHIPFDFSLTTPEYGDLLEAQKLYYMQVWLFAISGDERAIKNLLDKDMIFWRMASENSEFLLSKIISVTALKRHFLWSNSIIKKLNSDYRKSVVPDAWSIPFNKSELSLQRCLIGELAFSKQMLSVVKDKKRYNQLMGKENEPSLSDMLSSPLLQLQDSTNKLAEHFNIIINLFDVPLNEYPNALKIAKTFENEVSQEKWQIYNFTYYLLNSKEYPRYSFYFLRVANLEAMRRAALLATDLRNSHLPPEQLEEHMMKSNYTNPYDNKPFIWDAEKSAIVFDDFEKNENGHFELPY